MKTLILGIGNPLFSDDGVGLTVAWKLKKRLKDKNIFLKRTTLSGLNILGLLDGYDKAVIIDGMETESKNLGKCFRIEFTQQNYSNYSYHQMSIFQTLILARELKIDLPQKIVIYAIGIGRQNKISRGISKKLRDKLNNIVKEIEEDLCTD